MRERKREEERERERERRIIYLHSILYPFSRHFDFEDYDDFQINFSPFHLSFPFSFLLRFLPLNLIFSILLWRIRKIWKIYYCTLIFFQSSIYFFIFIPSVIPCCFILFSFVFLFCERIFDIITSSLLTVRYQFLFFIYNLL